MAQIRTVETTRGLEWIKQGWRYFMRQPKTWLGIGSTFMVAFIIAILIPVIGSLLASVVAPVFVSGMMFAARELEAGRAIEFGYLLRGFNEPKTMNKLFTLGGILVAGSFVSMMIGLLIVGGAILSASSTSVSPVSLIVTSASGLLALLLMLTVQLATTMAVVFAIPLVTFEDAPVGDAVRASFDACVRNTMPFLVFGLFYTVLGIVAAVLFGLLFAIFGFLGVLLAIASSGLIGAVSVCMIYASYRDCFITARPGA